MATKPLPANPPRSEVETFVALEASADESRIDETNHIIRGVKVIGRTSRARIRVFAEGRHRGKERLRGARVYVGHKRETSTRTGSYGERLGVLKNYRVQRAKGSRISITTRNILKADQLFSTLRTRRICSGSPIMPTSSFGSRTGKRSSRVSIKFIAWIVNVPATTKGVFESEADSMLTLKQMIDAATPEIVDRS